MWQAFVGEYVCDALHTPHGHQHQVPTRQRAHDVCLADQPHKVLSAGDVPGVTEGTRFAGRCESVFAWIQVCEFHFCLSYAESPG